MYMGEALVARLKADAAVTAIAQGRVFPERRPQDGAGASLPAVVLAVISGDRPQDLDGQTYMATTTVQASCFATKYGDSRKLAEAVVAPLLPSAPVPDP